MNIDGVRPLITPAPRVTSAWDTPDGPIRTPIRANAVEAEVADGTTKTPTCASTRYPYQGWTSLVRAALDSSDDGKLLNTMSVIITYYYYCVPVSRFNIIFITFRRIYRAEISEHTKN